MTVAKSHCFAVVRCRKYLVSHMWHAMPVSDPTTPELERAVKECERPDERAFHTSTAPETYLNMSLEADQRAAERIVEEAECKIVEIREVEGQTVIVALCSSPEPLFTDSPPAECEVCDGEPQPLPFWRSDEFNRGCAQEAGVFLLRLAVACYGVYGLARLFG